MQNRFWGGGLYILDEPESALSSMRQMALLCLMAGLVEKGSDPFADSNGVSRRGDL